MGALTAIFSKLHFSLAALAFLGGHHFFRSFRFPISFRPSDYCLSEGFSESLVTKIGNEDGPILRLLPNFEKVWSVHSRTLSQIVSARPVSPPSFSVFMRMFLTVSTSPPSISVFICMFLTVSTSHPPLHLVCSFVCFLLFLLYAGRLIACRTLFLFQFWPVETSILI